MLPNRSALVATMLRSAGKLSLFVGLSVALLLAVKHLTNEPIAQAERTTLLGTFNQVMPPALYNNDPLQDTTQITDPRLLIKIGTLNPVTVYRARQDGRAVGVILTTIAPNGYSGNITLLVGVLADGRVAGVRVLKHQETPGLGDKIEIGKHPWILEFNGRNLRDDNVPRWAVKKDGGDFDQFTGATITPRAVVQAVRQTLEMINEAGTSLYE